MALSTIRITALRGVPTVAADAVSLFTFVSTEGQTSFATSGFLSGDFEAKDCILTVRGLQIPYANISVSGTNLIYDGNFAAIGSIQLGDIVELRVFT